MIRNTGFMTSDDIRQQIELKVVELVKERLANGAMTEERAQQISKMVLDTLQPGMDYKSLFKAIPKLDDTMPELSSIILPTLRDYEQNVSKRVLQSVREYIKMGKYDAAIKIAQKAVAQDVDLVWQATGKPN